MSAAAAVAPRFRVPLWAQPRSRGGAGLEWVATAKPLLDRLHLVLASRVAHHLLGLMQMEADDERIVDLRQSAMAKRCGVTEVSIGNAVRSLIAHGLIEEIKSGRKRLYKLMIENWYTAESVNVPDDETAEEEESAEEEEETDANVVSINTQRGGRVTLAAGKARAITLPETVAECKAVRCRNTSSLPLGVTANVVDGAIEIEISSEVEETTSSAATSRRTDGEGDTQNKQVKPEIPKAGLGYSATLASTLIDVLGNNLGAPGPDILSKIARALGEAPLADLLAKIEARRKALFTGHQRSWGGVLKLAEEVQAAWKAAEAARAAAPKAEHEPAAVESSDELIEDAKLLMADPYASEEDKRFARGILTSQPEAAGWKPTDAYKRGAVVSRLMRLKQTVAGQSRKKWRSDLAQLADRIEREWPTLWAEHMTS